MNKAQLIQEAALKTGLTQKDTGKTLEAILDTIQSAVAAGDKVQLIGFGSFEPRDRQERKVVSPATKTEITVPATRVPAFKAGRSFKEAVAPKPEPTGKAKKKK